MSDRDLAERFKRAWGKCPAEQITLLVSGGGDSIALFFMLQEAGITFSCLHFQHGKSEFQLRASQFCRALCARFAVPFLLESIRVDGGRVSFEAEARRLRYSYVDQLSGVFLTAHTADDQAETVVMRLLDGSGLAGLAGVRRWRANVFRPLLGFRRSQLRAYLEQVGEPWLEDPTNLDGNDRAFLRAHVMPTLEAARPALVETLLRTAAELASDEDGLRSAAERFTRDEVLQGDHWPLPALRELHPAVRHRFFRHLWRQTAPGERPLGGVFRQAESLVLAGRDDRGVVFGRARLRRLGQHLWLEPLDLPQPREVAIRCGVAQTLMGHGWTVWPDGAPEGIEGVRLALPGKVFASDGEYAVRTRRPGDRYRGKTLKKLLGTLDHPPWVRDRLPLLTQFGEIVAVPGLDSEAVAGQACLVVDPWQWRWRLEK